MSSASAEAMSEHRRLIEVLGAQRGLYAELRALTEKQHELVEGDDPERLLAVLGARQRIIVRLAELGRALEPTRAAWERVSGELAASDRAEAQDLVGEVKRLLGEILAADERDSERLADRKQSVQKQLGTAALGQRLNRVYAQSAGGSRPANLIDRTDGKQ